MTSIVTDFKSIARKLNRQEQKAEFEAKNPKVEQSAYDALSGGMFGIGTPYCEQVRAGSQNAQLGAAAANSPLKSLAHPEWPYQGTGFEWSKFVKVKI
ncbi:hypothetical protein GA0061099_102115 [Bradyrhizobium yuanmingense]|uniref:Uncharacterized protein n=1 Tax=Bradyrhizobium yuanmingense TaxID=108015 RepID=A0A1C3XHD8_9BRAD|nr:hypothetical protein [Bradyrhizobium yuanmingense]TWI18976.1 hypothetical protein IQ15_07002 [Bradyrhizobium yuanmingense]SCB51691.1 hypothetical protein GA0061099_102115 [Bradyrhizobium yuanmingense]